ncbi:MAG: DUF4097 domain-containing protein [Marinilabiliaceae bacterium]|nr:DUF4097 domain-containing protein [Marinilabiliaceae bacterium]
MKNFKVFICFIISFFPIIVSSQFLIDSSDKTFSDVNSIYVKGVFCSVEFKKGASSAVILDGEIRAINPYDELLIYHRQKGNKLEVWVEMPPHIVGQIKGFLRFTAPSDITLTVENTFGNIIIDGIGNETVTLMTTAGTINANNIPCNAVFTTTTGSINCQSINGDLTVETKSGNISAKDIKGFATINGTSGTINLDKVKEEVNIISTSGSQLISGINSDVTTSATTGRIEVVDVKGNVDVSTTTGQIRLVDIVGEIKAESTKGAIKGNSIKITGNSSFESENGAIEMEFLNQPKTLSYDISSNSGSLEAEGTKNSRRVKIKEGDIMIEGVTTSGNQKYSTRNK